MCRGSRAWRGVETVDRCHRYCKIDRILQAEHLGGGEIARRMRILRMAGRGMAYFREERVELIVAAATCGAS